MGGILQSPKSNLFNNFLDSLIYDHGIDSEVILNKVNKKSDFTAMDIVQIANNLNISARNLLEQNIDIEALKSMISGNNNFIPKDYLIGAHSSTTSLKSVVTEFEQWGRFSDTLKYLQISEESLREHQRISISVVNKAIKYMEKFLSPQELTNIAIRNADAFLSTTDFGKEIYSSLCSKEPSEVLLKNIHLVERNWSYNIIKKNANIITVSTAQTNEVMDENPHLAYTTPHTNKIRFEFIKRVLNRSGNHCIINQISSVQKNGEFKFEIETTPLSIQPHPTQNLLHQ